MIEYTIGCLESILKQVAGGEARADVLSAAAYGGNDYGAATIRTLYNTTVQSALSTQYGRGEIILQEDALLWSRAK